MNYGFKLEDVARVETISPEFWVKVLERTKVTPLTTTNKYWGQEMLLYKAHAGSVLKRIDMNAGSQSSMEYHCYKQETYYVAYGELKVGVRVGRAENHAITVLAGEMLRIPPGLMHMRMAITDVVIIEWASADDPRDTHIVHDGQTYRFEEGPQ